MTLHFLKVSGMFEYFILVFEDNKKPILKLDKHDIENLKKEWSTDLFERAVEIVNSKAKCGREPKNDK